MTTATLTTPTAAPPSAESVALAKLIERHRSEYDFYVESAKADGVSDSKDLPAFPDKLIHFSFTKYIEAALAKAVYEPDEEDESVIIVSVPEMQGVYTYGKSREEAAINLIDLIESWLVSDLQIGRRIQPIEGVEITEYDPNAPLEEYDDGASENQDGDGEEDLVPVGIIKKIVEDLGITPEEWNAL